MNHKDNIKISTILNVVYSKIFLILKLSIFFQIPFILWLTLIQNDEYISKTIIKIEDTNNKKLSSGIDLIALSGINIQEDGAVSEIYEISRSLEFFEYFIEETNIPIQLIAAIPDKQNGWLIDSELYDQEENEWVRVVKYPLQTKPSAQELYEIFNEYFSSSIDPRTNYLKLSVEHFSPQISYYWLKTFLDKLIEYTRHKDRLKSAAIIDSYNKELVKIENKIIVKNLTEILTSNYLNNIISDALPSYKFNVLSMPFEPEFKENNKIMSFVVFSFVLYLFISIVIFFIYSPPRNISLSKIDRE